MEYKAMYHVKGGVSPGFGVKYSDQYDRTRKFKADDDIEGLKKAYSMAWKIANDALSDPEDDKTTVTLTSLRGPDEKEINQEEILRKIAKEKNVKNIEAMIEKEMSGGKILIIATMFDHILNL